MIHARLFVNLSRIQLYPYLSYELVIRLLWHNYVIFKMISSIEVVSQIGLFIIICEKEMSCRNFYVVNDNMLNLS